MISSIIDNVHEKSTYVYSLLMALRLDTAYAILRMRSSIGPGTASTGETTYRINANKSKSLNLLSNIVSSFLYLLLSGWTQLYYHFGFF